MKMECQKKQLNKYEWQRIKSFSENEKDDNKDGGGVGVEIAHC